MAEEWGWERREGGGRDGLGALAGHKEEWPRGEGGGGGRVPDPHTLRRIYQAMVTAGRLGWESVVPEPWVGVGGAGARSGLRWR